jgi:hypothetical protein
MILDSVLSNKVFAKTLGLESAELSKPSIRFFSEKFKRFNNCSSVYFNTKRVPINYFVLPKVSYFINTGQFRDVIIDRFQIDSKEIYISLIAAHFQDQYNKEGVPYFEFVFERKGSTFYFRSLNVIPIRERVFLPEVNYDKLQ